MADLYIKAGDIPTGTNFPDSVQALANLLASHLEVEGQNVDLSDTVDVFRQDAEPSNRHAGLLWLKTNDAGRVTSIQAFSGNDWKKICNANFGLFANAPTFPEVGELYFATDLGHSDDLANDHDHETEQDHTHATSQDHDHSGKLIVWAGSGWRAVFASVEATDSVLGTVRIPSQPHLKRTNVGLYVPSNLTYGFATGALNVFSVRVPSGFTVPSGATNDLDSKLNWTEVDLSNWALPETTSSIVFRASLSIARNHQSGNPDYTEGYYSWHGINFEIRGPNATSTNQLTEMIIEPAANVSQRIAETEILRVGQEIGILGESVIFEVPVLPDKTFEYRLQDTTSPAPDYVEFKLKAIGFRH
jgi:hypothetical protein